VSDRVPEFFQAGRADSEPVGPEMTFAAQNDKVLQVTVAGLNGLSVTACIGAD
jgi:hypothetical protein